MIPRTSMTLRLHPMVILAALPLLPASLFLNRGFTHWFHWMALAQFLTQSRFLIRFQAFVGLSICLGWYSSILYAWLRYGEFMKILYDNMPQSLAHTIVDQETGRIRLESSDALKAMAMTHVLDLMGHPLLTYYYWRASKRAGDSLQDILSWRVLVATYCFSRLWSITHCFHNDGKLGLYYFGKDVYIVENVDCYWPSYIAEGLVLALAVVFRVSRVPKDDLNKLTEDAHEHEDEYDTAKPQLVYSESGVSDSSISRNNSAASLTIDPSRLSLNQKIDWSSSTGGTNWARM